jgi:hypothetical protein
MFQHYPLLSETLSLEPIAKLNKTVTPAKAGVQNMLKLLDSGFRRNDTKGLLQEPH